MVETVQFLNNPMKIQRLQKNELSLLFKYALLEGWDVEEAHIVALYKTYPDDFFIAYKGKTLLGFIVAIKHGSDFGFISSFLVLQEFRSLGFGKKIFNFALQHLNNFQIALDSVVDKTKFYEDFGFKCYFDLSTYCFEMGSVTLPSSSIETVEIDETILLLINDNYLNNIINDSKINAKAIKTIDKISSYAFTFAYKDGYKIHIESNDINEAITLFFRLTDEFDKGTRVYLQASKLSPLLLALVQTLKMSEVSKFIRMYNKILD